ncbi:MAG: L-threonylcarbamoyladenylate synthase [Deltaproteobacteria bacterium]|nr:L-threonylcarbamoyladenylate synthase [Deltaproteobacteria bacterium]
MTSPENPARIITQPWTQADQEFLTRQLEQGGVLSYPTETAYALGGNALLPQVAREVYRLKERSPDKALLLLIDGGRGVEELARGVSPEARRLMERFWPGPLTLVFHSAPGLPAHLPDRRGTVALRWSPHPLLAALHGLKSVPLIGTSANLSGEPPLLTAGQVREHFPRGLAAVLDGGQTPGGLPSTLVDTTCSPACILRRGAIEEQAIRDCLG